MVNKYNPEEMISFNFYRTWSPIFRCLPLDDRGILLNWICWYCFEGCEPTEENFHSDALENAWLEIKPQLDSQFEKWRDFCNRKNSI